MFFIFQVESDICRQPNVNSIGLGFCLYLSILFKSSRPVLNSWNQTGAAKSYIHLEALAVPVSNEHNKKWRKKSLLKSFVTNANNNTENSMLWKFGPCSQSSITELANMSYTLLVYFCLNCTICRKVANKPQNF